MKIYIITIVLLFTTLSTHGLAYIELEDHEHKLNQVMSDFSDYMSGLLNSMALIETYTKAEESFTIVGLKCNVEMGPGKVTITSDSITLERQMLDYNLLTEYYISKAIPIEPYHYVAHMMGKLGMESTITYYFNKPIGQRFVITDISIGMDLVGQVTTLVDDGEYTGDKEKFAKDMIYDAFINERVLGLKNAFNEFTKDK
jgi:hypothetical protein